MGKVYGKCTPRASPRPLFNFGKQLKVPMHARNSFEKYNILRGQSKNL